MKTIYYLPLGIYAMCAVPAMAQEAHPAHSDTSPIDIINKTDNIDSTEVEKAFKANSPAAYNIPDAPRFAIVGKNKSFYLGIGGQVKTTLGYDFGSPIHNANEFATSAIPMHPEKGNDALVQFSAMQSGLSVNFVAMPDNPNRIGAYFNFNLINGNDYGFNLVYAYIKYRGFTVGYDYSLFSDMAAAPPTIDYEGPNAFTAIPNGVIDYRHSFGKHFSVGAGIEMPQASYTTGAYTGEVSQRVPDIPAYLQWAFTENSRIRLSGMLRNITYRDNQADKNRNAVGWGVKLSGTVQPAQWLTAYYQACYGNGIASYFQDLNGQDLDLTPDPAQEGRLKPVKAWGGYIGLQFNITKKLYCSGTFSYLRAYPKEYQGGETLWGDQYKYARYVVGNVFYNFNRVLSWGLEYIYGSRRDMSGLTNHDNRLQTMLQVSF